MAFFNLSFALSNKCFKRSVFFMWLSKEVIFLISSTVKYFLNFLNKLGANDAFAYQVLMTPNRPLIGQVIRDIAAL